MENTWQLRCCTIYDFSFFSFFFSRCLIIPRFIPIILNQLNIVNTRYKNLNVVFEMREWGERFYLRFSRLLKLAIFLKKQTEVKHDLSRENKSTLPVACIRLIAECYPSIVNKRR